MDSDLKNYLDKILSSVGNLNNKFDNIRTETDTLKADSIKQAHATEKLQADNQQLRAQLGQILNLLQQHKIVDNSNMSNLTATQSNNFSTGEKSGSTASKYANPPSKPATTPDTSKSDTTDTGANKPDSKPESEWIKIVRKPAKSKAPLSNRKLFATARAFYAPPPADAPSGYTYVYIPRSRSLDRKDIRHRFSLLGISTARIVDIMFPARSAIGVLIHKEFMPEFLQILKECKVTPLDSFDPLDPVHIVDPKFRDLSKADRVRLAAALQQDRCLRTMLFVREYLLPSVSKFFLEQGWIPQDMASMVLHQRMPRPLKKRNTMGFASAAEAFMTGASDEGRVILDMDGNPVEIPMVWTTTEEFHENAHGDESTDDDEEDLPLAETSQ